MRQHVAWLGGLATDLQGFASEVRNDMRQVRHQLSKALEKLDELLEHMAELKAASVLDFRCHSPRANGKVQEHRHTCQTCHVSCSSRHTYFLDVGVVLEWQVLFV